MIRLPKRAAVRDPASALAYKRLEVLKLAEELGNVSEACRRSGMERTRFYDWRRRYDAHGLDGLKDRPPTHKAHPMTTPGEVVKRIRELALLHPARGCEALQAMLALEGQSVSSVTIQKALNRHGLGSREQRWLALEQRAASGSDELSPEQIAFLEARNPCLAERHSQSERPGELLACYTFMAGTVGHHDRIYLHAVVDTFGSYAFGQISASARLAHTVAVLREAVLPFYAELDVPVTAVRADEVRWSRDNNPLAFDRFLARNGIEQIRARSGKPNGFASRFKDIVCAEFFQPGMHHGKQILALQGDLDAWLHHYNHERAHPGYRNYGRCPWDIVQEFVGR